MHFVYFVNLCDMCLLCVCCVCYGCVFLETEMTKCNGIMFFLFFLFFFFFEHFVRPRFPGCHKELSFRLGLMTHRALSEHNYFHSVTYRYLPINTCRSILADCSYYLQYSTNSCNLMPLCKLMQTYAILCNIIV